MKALMKLNPYSAVVKKSAGKVLEARKARKAALLAKKRGVLDKSADVGIPKPKLNQYIHF